MIDLHLQAEDEAALVAALPLLRGEQETVDGVKTPVWTSGPHHAVDAGIAIVTTPAVLDDEGKVTTPAVLDPRFHANLRLDEDHPGRDAILAAARPFTVMPASPRRIFA